ncbi:MAG TPA: hypothetical protein VFJ58_18200 [Armatimonadota bacterium]|nr:hypothetical protein [Armatimonadota bacterium]
MESVMEWQASVIEGAANALAFWVGTTREDRLNWTPSAEPDSKTRSVLEVAHECVGSNRRAAAILGGSTPPEGPPPFTDVVTAQQQLKESAKELADVVRGLSESDLTRTFQTGLGPMPGRLMVHLPAMNMIYHGGQVNYIQRLYGDTEFRVPPPPPGA